MPSRLPDWIIGASAAAAGVVLTPVLASAALGIVGFSAAGPVAGTLAASIQSGIGNVAAGSAFAVAQSIAMGGAIPTGVYAASSGVFAGAAAWTARRFGGNEPDPTLIRKQLDSGSDRPEKLDAMRTLIALMNNGRDISEYFPQVVKNVTSQIFEIRKLVYIYLVRYAEQEPELSLRFINTFQRDLNDNDPLIQAMALRVLCGIRAPTTGNTAVPEEIKSEDSSQEGNAGGASSEEEDVDKPDSNTLIRRHLDSGSDEEKLDAMKRIIALISEGHNVPEYLPQVAKNLDSQNLEIRELVYIYLLKYAEDLLDGDGSSEEGSSGGASSEEEDVDKPSRSSIA